MFIFLVFVLIFLHEMDLNKMIKINDRVELVITISNKTGVLSSIMSIGVEYGLMLVKNKSIKIDDSTSRLLLVFNGKLNCSEVVFKNELKSHSEILTIDQILLDYPSELKKASLAKEQKDKMLLARKTNIKLQAFDIITPQSKQLAEEKLRSFLGPVASVLIESALTKTKHIGDFYLLLSDELEGKEKRDFLGLVSGLNSDE